MDIMDETFKALSKPPRESRCTQCGHDFKGQWPESCPKCGSDLFEVIEETPKMSEDSLFSKNPNPYFRYQEEVRSGLRSED